MGRSHFLAGSFQTATKFFNGTIDFQYFAISSPGDQATIGIQDSTGLRGTTVTRDAPYARAGLRVREVPIEFIDRKRGVSKLTLLRLAVGYLWIARLRLFGR